MKIRVAVCQVDMEWEHTARNLERLEPIVAAADADIAVLPEMFATGFKLRPARVAHFLLNAVAGKFAPGDTAEDPQRVAGRLQPQGNHIAHHQQVGQ